MRSRGMKPIYITIGLIAFGILVAALSGPIRVQANTIVSAHPAVLLVPVAIAALITLCFAYILFVTRS